MQMLQVSVKSVAKSTSLESSETNLVTSVEAELHILTIFPVKYFTFYRLSLSLEPKTIEKINTYNGHFAYIAAFKMTVNAFDNLG